uniref:Splicing factor 3B subunit 4 n=1 Tax=Aegilops tauschii TaxID=37682 RepID=R7W280_AEGTA
MTMPSYSRLPKTRRAWMWEVDEKLLYDTFSAFGVIVTNPKIMRDPETGNSRGFGFVSYDSFESSDQAIEAMNNQHLCNRPITVSYAYKKDTKGERHGTPAERLLAANNPGSQKHRPHTMFATAPPTQGLQNGGVGAPVPRPFANGNVPGQMQHVRPPPPPVGQYPPMQMHGQPAWPGPPQHMQQVTHPMRASLPGLVLHRICNKYHLRCNSSFNTGFQGCPRRRKT